MKQVTIAAIAVLASATAAEAQNPDNERILRKIASTNVTVDFSDMPLEDFARQIGSFIDENVVVMGEVAEEVPAINIKLSDVTVRTVINLALGPYGVIYVIEDGVCFFRKKGSESLKLEMYDVKDLIAPLTDFPGVDIALSSNQIGVNTQTDEGEVAEGITEDILIELIQAHTAGDSWDTLEGASCTAHGGVLVVRQTKGNHVLVEKFISRLRRLK